MMATIIIVGSVVLAAGYALLWWAQPALRRQIEAPSERFAAAAKRYDSVCRDSHERGTKRKRSDDDAGK